MSLKVIIVDDDRHYARLLSYRLEKHDGYEVSVYGSGERLLESLSEPPDLILLDVMMPGLSGIEILQALRARFPELPVLVVSAQGVIGTAAEAIQLGAYDYVTKGQDDLLRLDVIVKNIQERKELKEEVARLRQELAELKAAR